MTVREWLNSLKNDQLVKIGAKDGTNFVYCGRVNELNAEIIDMSDLVVAGNRKKDKPGLEPDDGSPLMGREVVETFRSQAEEAQICIYKGQTRGRGWLCDESPKPLKKIHPDGAALLAQAIYEDASDEMKSILRTIRKKGIEKRSAEMVADEMYAITETEPPQNYADAAMNEYEGAILKQDRLSKEIRVEKGIFQRRADWICGDEYGLLTDPVGVVESIIEAERQGL